MRTIQVTVELITRRCKDVEIDDETYRKFIKGEISDGEIPELGLTDFIKECEEGTHYDDYDYQITDDEGRTIVPWK